MSTPSTHVTNDGDRIVIRTTARKAEAILLVLSGCTLEEVGQRFGVTRERVRQYLRDAGLVTKHRQRFHATPTYATRGWMESHNRRQRRYHERQRRIRRVVLYLKLFHATHGRAPTYCELAELVRGKSVPKSAACSSLAAYLGRYRPERAARCTRAVYRLAGLAPRRVGTPGHRSAA